MLIRTYEYIWRNVIEPNITCIESKASKSSQNSALVLVTDDMAQIKDKILKSYEKKRDMLKNSFHYDDGDKPEERRIDSHKIAACFAAVIYEEKIFSYDLSKDVTDDVFLANARLAYYVSLGIINMNLVYHYKRNHKQAIADELMKQKQLKQPPTNPGHDPYNVGREKTLALNEIFGNGFDILTYSDMMFWIEYYNRQILEQTISPQPFEIYEDIWDQ